MDNLDIQTLINVILNKWAVAIQISILLVLTIVFIALWKKFPRKVVYYWMLAWSLNLLGLCAIFAVLYFSDKLSKLPIKTIYLLYAYCKVWFAVLLVYGLKTYLKHKDSYVIKNFKKTLLISLLPAIVILASPLTTLHMQLLVYIIVGVIFILNAIYHTLNTQKNSNKFLTGIIFFEGMVFLQHAWVLYPTLWGGIYPDYMTHASFLDSIIELTVGISCLFAVIYKIIDEIQLSNNVLEKTQKNLRKLVDNDPLTGLWNRRKLDDYIKNINFKGTLIYIDINDFKKINDIQGHNIGDKCLKRIAKNMKSISNENLGYFRLGGDEFLVIIPTAIKLNPLKFITTLKNSVAFNSSDSPKISLAIGYSEMNEKISFSQALEIADSNMYNSKNSKR